MVHVEDVVRANIFAMNHERPFKGQHFDVGTGDNISLNEAKAIVQRHHHIDFNYIEARTGEILETRADPRGLAQLGWATNVAIEDGIQRCFDF